jgi:methylated-DNA-[protein]-cysteine S-methyltransferase
MHMKVKVEVDCTPEEARRFMGLPDLTPVHEAYVAGELTVFDLPLVPAASDRGPELRAAICSIIYGETASYGDLAARTGASARAVGQACASNPFPIIVPCHRVLPTGGALGFYSAGDGPATKAWLLKHEHAEGWLL